MSTEADIAQATKEGYWPKSHSYVYIDAHAVKLVVKDFITRNPAPKTPAGNHKRAPKKIAISGPGASGVHPAEDE